MTKLVRVDPPRPALPRRQGYLVRGTIAPVFVERDALAPPDAIPFTPADAREAEAFDALRRSGAIRPAGGNWWLDMVAYQAAADERSRRAVPWLVIGSVVIAVVAMMLY